ncbi:MAG TPA: O-antigen ligase family protein [Candidatus Goldiibacteriota bacterium]|nr:O-antigen ligase family protein [Candidatus Goldiibacteriota bacterium]HRQ43631.1 O-antigen ligase family protein [Candidatus Goldiibacteriota bacterium]
MKNGISAVNVFTVFIIAALALVPVAVNTASYNIVHIKDIIFLICAFGAFFAWLFSKNSSVKAVALLPLAYFAWAAVCAAAGDYGYAALKPFAVYAAIFVFFTAVSNHEGLNLSNVRNAVIITSVPAVITGMAQSFMPGLFKGFMVFGDRIPSLFGNPNFFAAYLAAVIPITLWRTLYGLGSGKFFSLIITAASVFCLYKTGSKAGLLTAAVEFIILIWAVTKQRHVKIAVRYLIIAVLAFFAFFFAAKALGISGKDILKLKQWEKNESVFFREQVWSGAAKMIQDRPVFGHGPGAFTLSYPPYRTDKLLKWMDQHDYEVTYPENFLLQIAVETGIPGLLIFGAMLIFLLLHFSREEKEETDFKLGFVGLLFINLFGVDLNYTPSYMMAVFYAGIFLNDYRGRSLKINGAGRIITAAAAAAVFITACIFHVKNETSDVKLNTAVYMSRDKNWNGAVLKYEQALKLNPDNLTALYFSGNAKMDRALPSAGYEALADYKKLSEKAPNYVLLHYRAAKAYYRAGSMENAELEYKKMIALDPYFMPALSELAYLYYFDRKDAAAAEGLLLDVIKRSPDDPSFYNNLGNIYFGMKKYDDAVLYYNKAAAMKPSADYFYNLGCVYLAKDMPEEAVENLEKASQLDVNKANQKIQVMLNIARGQAMKRKGR